MGLDMFLTCTDEDFVADYTDPDDRFTGGQTLVYWRKANQIHAWFDREVGGAENCEMYPVGRWLLERLLADCEEVLRSSRLVEGMVTVGWRCNGGDAVAIKEPGEVLEDPSTAKRLLPTMEGFFFGVTEYTGEYVEQLRDTMRALRRILGGWENLRGQLAYHAWW